MNWNYENKHISTHTCITNQMKASWDTVAARQGENKWGKQRNQMRQANINDVQNVYGCIDMKEPTGQYVCVQMCV